MNKKTLLAALFCCSAVFFTACDDDDDDKIVTITFEDAQLGEAGFINNAQYKERGYVFSNKFTTSDNGDSWYGYSVSNKTDKETEGYLNQYSVYAGSGAKGSKQFAIAFQGAEYDENWNSTPVYSSFEREDGASFSPVSAYFALTTYTYLSTQKGDAYAKKFEAGDFYKVTVIGTTADGKTNEVVFDAINIDNNVAFTSWQNISLKQLGEVVKVELKFESSDTGAYGMNTPAYIAIDNIEIAE